MSDQGIKECTSEGSDASLSKLSHSNDKLSDDLLTLAWTDLENRNWCMLEFNINRKYLVDKHLAKQLYQVQSRARQSVEQSLSSLQYNDALELCAKGEIARSFASDIFDIIEWEWENHPEDRTIVANLVKWCNSKDEELMQNTCWRLGHDVSVFVHNIQPIDVEQVLWCSIDNFYESEGRMSDEHFAKGMLERLQRYKHLATPEQLVFMEKHIATLEGWLKDPTTIDMEVWKGEHSEACDYFR